MTQNDVHDKNILVIGDIMLDIYKNGAVNRISPESPVPVVKIKKEVFCPGGAANVAANLCRLGCNVFVAGYAGDDKCGQILLEILDNFQHMSIGSIDTQCVVKVDIPTVTKTRIMCGKHHFVRYDDDSYLKQAMESGRLSSEFMTQKIFKLLKAVKIDAIVYSDYDKGAISYEVTNFIDENKDDKAIITCDIKPQNVDMFTRKNISCVFPNLKEARELSKSENLNSIAKDIAIQMRTKSVLITLGEDGMFLLDDNDHAHAIPGIRCKEADVTGAGDTVVSVFTLAKTMGMTDKEAACLSNKAASCVVNKSGTDSGEYTFRELINATVCL